MDYREIAYEAADGVLTLTLDRPDKLNAFTPRMLAEMLDALDRADADDEVRVVVVTGRGRGFCAGADLSAGGGTFDAGERGQSPDLEGAEAIRDGGGRLTLRIFECRKPVIAAINGPAVGVGITMTLPMDIRLVARGAKLGFVFARRGIAPEAASSWFLPRIVGISQAMEWVATGRTFDADEALRAGLVRSVHEPGEVLPAAYGLAREIADNTSAVSVAVSRLLLWRMLGAEHPMHAHRADSRAIHELGRSADAREGVSAFLEKRPARFTDRVSTSLPEVMPGWEPPRFA